MGWVAGEQNLLFYKNDGWIAVKDHIWVQDTLMVTATMFRRVGLDTNLENTKALVCTPRYICGKWIKAAYKRRDIGGGGQHSGRLSG